MVSNRAKDVNRAIVLSHRIVRNVTTIRANVAANQVSPDEHAIDACQAIGTTHPKDAYVSDEQLGFSAVKLHINCFFSPFSNSLLM